MIHYIYALVLGLHFCVQIFRFMLDLLFIYLTHEENIYLAFFTFPSYFNVGSYWPRGP